MGKTYTKTLVETTAAMSLIPKLAGVLANHRFSIRQKQVFSERTNGES